MIRKLNPVLLTLLCAFFALCTGASVSRAASMTRQKKAPAKKPVSAKEEPKSQARTAKRPAVKGSVRHAGTSKAEVKAHSKVEALARSPELVWIKSASTWTRTIRAYDPSGTTPFAESLALAVDGRFLVVPWSFVSGVTLARPGAHFYLDEPRQEATVVDLDVMSNMALLKTEGPLVPSFYRTQIRLESPMLDEPLLVLASRDWLRQGARFLKAKNDGSYMRYQISLGSPDFATARYIFDRLGRLVAVSAGSDADKEWSGSARSLFDLLRRQDGPHPASIPTSEQRRRQLFYWQERWAQAMIPSKASLSLQSLDCQAYLASVGDSQLASQVRSVRAMDCEGKFPLQLGGGYTTGVHLWSGEASLKSADEDVGQKLAQSFAADAFNELNKTSALVNLMTVPECGENTVANQHGQSVHVKFCTTALKVEPGLSDTAISVSSVERGSQAYFAVARLKGFDEANTKKMIESLVENVRSLK